MTITSLTVHNIRAYSRFTCDISPNVTMIVGANGSGKTTLLESIYIAAQGTSFRGRDREVIAYTKTQAGIKLNFTDDTVRSVSIQALGENKLQKVFTINNQTRRRLSFYQKMPVVLFEPEVLRSLTGSPQRRRGFIDTMLVHTQPNYSAVLRRFERTLLQRNELLKQKDTMNNNDWNDQLFVWDVVLSKAAQEVHLARTELLGDCNTQLSDIYSQLAGKNHQVTVAHQSAINSDNYQQQLLSKLKQSQQVDSLRGYTSYGPQRDDFIVTINNRPAIEVASRGEMRTIMLAFKYIELKLVEDRYQQKPLLLLDDVFSELDTTRKKQLTQVVKQYQSIITTTDADMKLLNSSVKILTL